MNDAQLNIAVCDDEAYMREMLCKELERQFAKRKINIHITEYDAGEGLLEADSLFDMIFLDIEMPVINGIELAKRLKETDRNIRIIFVTIAFVIINNMNMCFSLVQSLYWHCPAECFANAGNVLYLCCPL